MAAPKIHLTHPQANIAVRRDDTFLGIFRCEQQFGGGRNRSIILAPVVGGSKLCVLESSAAWSDENGWEVSL